MYVDKREKSPIGQLDISLPKSAESVFLPEKERDGRGKGEKLRCSSLGKEAQGIGERARSTWEQSFAMSTFGWSLWSSSG